MRRAFIKTLVTLAERDERILLLTGDLGYMTLEPFAERFPGRFFNVGVAEQNMVGLATGLAEAGFIPFVYSIAPFACLRPYEFIRNGPIAHRLPVRIVGVGGGFEYGHNGLSHYALEDIGVMRIQPGISVVAPADVEQARSALEKTWGLPGPVYYRIGKDEKTLIPGLGGRFEPGRAQTIGDGTDVLLIATGAITTEAAAAVALLAERGIRSTLMVVASVQPSPVDDIARELAKVKVAVTVEAHYIAGGLGSLVAEVAAAGGISCKVIRLGVAETPGCEVGSQAFLQRRHGIDAAGITERIERAVGSRAGSGNILPERGGIHGS
ncbi:MAG: transketolase C-terminal domain-containing protein [Candidatus Omnitrophota bacterium]